MYKKILMAINRNKMIIFGQSSQNVAEDIINHKLHPHSSNSVNLKW
jgi:hypothetical protein